MKTLTAKERAKMYRKAFEGFYKTGIYKYDFCCNVLALQVWETHRICTSAYGVLRYFPELQLFQRPTNPMGGGWWPMHDKECRAYAMLLCEQIALDSKN